MRESSIHINGIDFKWGMTFQEVINIFKFENISTGRSLWNQFEIECKSILGLDSLACQFRAPSINRPVMQCSFDLKTIDFGFLEKPHTPYIKSLTKVLGTPDDKNNIGLDKGLRYNKGYSSGRVIYSADWWKGDILISLSVFGGIRTKKQGQYAAGLYFHWLNEINTAVPYLTEFIEKENSYTNSYEIIDKINLRYSQRQFFVRHYELNDPEIALKDKDVRTSQLILYTDFLFRTPNEISKDLFDNEIIVFKSKEPDTWCVGNKWDFSIIDKESRLKFIKVLPGRGSGGTEIKINSLTIEDVANSQKLTEFCTDLEQKTGLTFKREERYGD